MAVSERNLPAIELLLEKGANPLLRTRIDEYETPREMAVRAGLNKIAALLAEYEAAAGKVTAICCRRANSGATAFVRSYVGFQRAVTVHCHKIDV